jgi:uncharacterized protein YgiM (DUF1202 family)
MKRSALQAVLLAGILAFTCTSAFAESVWVKSEVVELRAGKGSAYAPVAKVKKGTELNVIQREGNWIKVAIPAGKEVTATEGYIFEGATSLKKVGSGGNMFSGLSGAGGDISTAAAAKGLNPAANSYAEGKHMSPAPLDNLIAARWRINPREHERFMAEGRLGGMR